MVVLLVMAEAELTLKFSQMNGLGGLAFCGAANQRFACESSTCRRPWGEETTKSSFRFGEVGSEKGDLQAVESFKQSEVPT